MKITAILLSLCLASGFVLGCSRDLEVPQDQYSSQSQAAQTNLTDEPSEETMLSKLFPKNSQSESAAPEPEPSAAPNPIPSMTVDFSSLEPVSRDLVVWGPGVHRDEIGRSIACVDLQKRYGEKGAHFIGDDKEYITLSFDQGYENGFTASILDTLKEKQVQAIFFITGDYLRTQPELIQRMIDEGHIVGNHSDRHIDFSKEPAEKCFNDLKTLHDNVKETFDYDMWLFRYPAGTFSEQSLSMMQQVGYKPVFWSFAYNDWNPDKQMEPDAAMVKVKEFLHPGEIMLLHSVGKTNSLILGDMIDYIRDQGYTIGPTPELLA